MLKTFLKVRRWVSFMTMMEKEEGGEGERLEERSEGQIMSDGEEETILWSV